MSSEVAMMTRAGPWRKVRSVNCTDSSFDSRIPLAVDPFVTAGASGDSGTATGSSVMRITDELNGGQAQSGMHLQFFGVGADTTTFSARIIGWSPMVSSQLSVVTPETQIWIPNFLIEVSVALSVMTGLANKAIVATEVFADTITVVGTTGGTAGIDYKIRSPANDTIADLYVDLWGNTEVEVVFDMTGATSGNALCRFY